MMNSFQEYLISKGAINADEATKNVLWSEYRRKYMKHYNESRRKTDTKRVEVLFSIEEYKDLLDHSKELGIKKSSDYIRKAVRSCIDDIYIVPDEKLLQLVELGLADLGAKLNQIVYRVNKQQGCLSRDIDGVYRLFKELQDQLYKDLSPFRLEYFIERQFLKDPQIIDRIELVLNKYKNNDH